VDVFIEESGTCATDTPVKFFSYPENQKRICFMDKPFRQVKHLPAFTTAWFYGNDNLEGTTVVGTEGTTDAEWAIGFNGITFSNFLFASGDFKNFVYTSKSILNVSGGPI
jgi:hypothetical protein